MKRVKGIKEKNVNWSTFKRYFKNKFLSEQYYEEREKEFYEFMKLKIHEKNCATYDLELTVVIHALKIWRHHLIGIRFIIND